MVLVPAQTSARLDRLRAEPERRIGWQYAVGLVFFLIANIGGSVIGVIANIVAHGGFTAAELNQPWPGTTIAMAIEATLSVLGFVLMMRWLAGRPAVELGRPWAGELSVGLAIGVGLMTLAVALVAALGGYRVSGVHVGVGLITGVAVGVGAGFAEEIFFEECWSGSSTSNWVAGPRSRSPRSCSAGSTSPIPRPPCGAASRS